MGRGGECGPNKSSRSRFQIDSAFQGQEGLALVEKGIAEGDGAYSWGL